jgi:hypothetical protein
MKKLVILVMVFLAMADLLAQDRDPKADEIADKVMAAMGGQENYDNTRYLAWRFFGRRLHVWDKWTGNVRIEDGQGMVILMNINTKEGKAWKDGEPVADEGAVAEALDNGWKMWINDSYGWVMHDKLKDPGVTLVYSGERAMEDGNMAHVLTLTFDSVGVTPQNKYEVFVNQETNLVEQWAFFTTAEDAEPRFINPWKGWTKHGKIMLSADRGRWQHSDVAAYDTLPESIFNNPEDIDLASLQPL